MKGPHPQPHPLYQRLLALRRVLPIAAFLLVLAHQALEHAWLSGLPRPLHMLSQIAVYGTVGPALAWLTLTWLAERVRERDEAEAHLRALYQVSRQAAITADMDALIEIALSMPAQVLGPVSTSLILREHPEGPWVLAGTRNLHPEHREAIEAHLTTAGAYLRCGRCRTLAATVREGCPLLCFSDPQNPPLQVRGVICLPLSTGDPPHALLNVYLIGREEISPSSRRVVESMAALLAVAMDHARLRAREFQMLDRMEQVMRRREGLADAVGVMLGEVALAHRAEAGAVFLVLEGEELPALLPIAGWPGREVSPSLTTLAHQALEGGEVLVGSGTGEADHRVAVPLVAEGQVRGVLALVGQQPFTSTQLSFLKAAAGMMALLIRNSQLYGELERQAILEERSRLAREVHDGLAQSLGFLNFKVQQIERLLGRGHEEAARQALRELREVVQDLYGEVRLTIHDLRWSPDPDQGLVEHLQQYVEAFADRTGLEVSLAVEGEPFLSPGAEVQLFRVAQEALVNVHRHARARRVWVRLRSNADEVTLEVEDDGVGLPAGASNGGEHFGLRIMQERVEAMGGDLTLQSAPGRGTLLRVAVRSPRSAVPSP
ncbi:MAG TPA: hypothetical protein ENK56_07090 [Chloroflexi bacterium]|nr:hypothetical protein [Chloroflexota bacterium]